MEISHEFKAEYFGDRKKYEPKMIVIHYTGGSKIGDLATLTGKSSRIVSAHYYITKKGEIYCLVDEDYSAYHAGVSKWKDYAIFEWTAYSVNKTSIGIELENKGFEEYTEKQIESLIELIKDINSRWQIAEDDIVGHSHVSPGRKIDPGDHFPWLKVKQGVFGKEDEYPDWAEEGVKFCKEKGLITKITSEPITDYRLAVILERFYKLTNKQGR